MVQLHAVGSEYIAVITVKGSLTARITSELRASVGLALRSFNRVVLDLEQATDIDMDCLQFLCLAHHSAAHEHKSLMVAGALASKPVLCTGCVLDAGKSCSECR